MTKFRVGLECSCVVAGAADLPVYEAEWQWEPVQSVQEQGGGQQSRLAYQLDNSRGVGLGWVYVFGEGEAGG